LTNNDVKLAKKITRDGKNYFLGDSGNVCTKLAHTKYYAIYFEQPCHGIKFSPSGRLPLVCYYYYYYYGLLTDSADEDIDSKFPSNVVIYADGQCNWVPLGLFISSCAIDIRWFPFDDQRCRLKFGSWTYDGNSINMTIPGGKERAVSPATYKPAEFGEKQPVALDTYQPSGEWQLIGERRLQA